MASPLWNFGTGHVTYIFVFWCHKYNTLAFIHSTCFVCFYSLVSFTFRAAFHLYTIPLAILSLVLSFGAAMWSIDLIPVMKFDVQTMLGWLWIPRVRWKVWREHYYTPICYCIFSRSLPGNNLLTVYSFPGSAITGPIGKECADLWPRIASAANAIV